MLYFSCYLSFLSYLLSCYVNVCIRLLTSVHNKCERCVCNVTCTFSNDNTITSVLSLLQSNVNVPRLSMFAFVELFTVFQAKATLPVYYQRYTFCVLKGI